jgi:acyltransferase
MEKKREEWIDNLKGLGIILIVLGHCGFPKGSILVGYVFTFHVPLFFFISGFLFSPKKDANAFGYLKSRFNRLMVPYFWFNIIAYLGLGITIKSYHYLTVHGFEKFIENSLIGNYTRISENTLVNGGTWFLPCLFVTGMYYYLLDKKISNKKIKLLIIIILSIFIFIESKFIHFRLPWGIDIAIMALFFYGVGNLFQSEIKRFANKINSRYLFLVPVLIGINILLLNGTNMSTNQYGNYFNFVFCSFSGIITLIIISKVVGKSFLGFYGANSIIVLGMEWIQGLCYSLLVIISSHALPKETNYLTGFAQFLFFLALMVPVIKLINHYLPFLLGIKRRAN